MTDEQRRSAAARLRECGGGWTSGTCYYTIIQPIGLPDTSREDGGHALYSALADLIDPDCREGARPPRPVDREALLALAEEMTWCYEGAASAEGDGTVGAWVVMSYADRIREACGEVVQ